MAEQERSPSGDPIYRYQPSPRGYTPPQDAGCHVEAIEAHVEKHLGPVESVFHEIVSDLVHLDVLMVPPNGRKPFHSLVTSGVSERAMNIPEGAGGFNRVELMIHLPPDWLLDQKSFEEESHYWPVRWLKIFGRVPHNYDTWIGWGHTIPNGDPAEPIADTGFTGFLLSPPYWLGADFFLLKVDEDTTIAFFDMTPLYPEEMELKLAQGVEALEERFEQHEIGPVVDIRRTNVAAKKRRGWSG